MTGDVYAVLQRNLEGMRKALRWLRRSQDKCRQIGIKVEYSDDEFDDFENLVSRFARSVDLVVNKVFRSIDAVELEDGGTLIDVVNRAEKRSLVDSTERIRGFKDLRNDIVHEYETEELRALFRQVLEAVPEIYRIAESIERYCVRFTDRP